MQQLFQSPEEESPPVSPERSHWRDLALNDRHRMWGWNCPANDLDFIEYDHGRAVALVEYKHERAKATQPTDSNIRALCDVANRAKLPAFGAVYSSDFAYWVVTALNAIAAQALKVGVNQSKAMTEMTWVEFLYQLRGRVLPDDVAAWIAKQRMRQAERS